MFLSASYIRKAISNSSLLSSTQPLELLQLPASNVACPRDNVLMRTLKHRDVELDVCPSCQSIWLDSGEYEKIVNLEETQQKKTENSLDINITPSNKNASHDCPSDSDHTANLDGVLDFVGEAVGSLFDGI